MSMENEEVRQECSIPASSRISLITLAELRMFWDGNGVTAHSISMLVAWSLDLLAKKLVEVGAVQPITSVHEANKIMEGLYQKSMKNRAMKKISAALGFESMREEGIDPRSYVPGQYNTVHNSHSVRGVTAEPKIKANYQQQPLEPWQEERLAKQKAEFERRQEISRLTEEAMEKDRQREKEKVLQAAKDSGLVVRPAGEIRGGEEPSNDIVRKQGEGINIWEWEKRERAIRERENAPIDMEEMKKFAVKDDIDHPKNG